MNMQGSAGILSTFNQRCGLATYAQYLVDELSRSITPIIFAEDVPDSELIRPDQDYVVRCWRREADDYSALLAAVLRSGVKVLHLNCHYRFFKSQALTPMLRELRAQGVATIAHVHNPYSLDPSLEALVKESDHVVVHTPENRLEVLANGARPESISVIEHGVKQLESPSSEQARALLGIPAEQKVLVAFGFIQAHKGIDEVVQACAELGAHHPDLHLYVVGGVHREDPTSQAYRNSLDRLLANLNIASRVHINADFISEDDVASYLKAADAVVLNYRSRYFEASGALARAIGSGAPVITSLAPPFSRLADSVFHVTSGYPLPLAIELVLYNPAVSTYLRSRSRKWCEEYSWAKTAGRFIELYEKLTASQPPSEINSQQPKPIKRPVASIRRVLMQNRPNALTQRGGDTVVMERVAEGLRNKGIEVVIDCENRENPQHFDLVHLYNFATPQITEALAKACEQVNVPFVVTTMYEDLPKFYNQMIVLFKVLNQYVSEDQPRERWPELVAALNDVQPSGRWENTWTAEHASALIASGDREKQTLERDYPQAQFVTTYRLGCDVTLSGDDGTLFREQTGISDFVFCVGRLETRKNQLMLLKALEDSDLPLVFATGGFTYQPDYEALCRKFKRKGQTVFLDRLSPELLASAYAAAKVHALPSWYELPGIVSMEAAKRNTNVVVSDLGTVYDYFGNLAYYCKPDDAESIYNAVLAGYYAPTREGLSKQLTDCLWDNAAERVLQIYQDVLGQINRKRSTYELPEWSIRSERDVVNVSLEGAADATSAATASLSQLSQTVEDAETQSLIERANESAKAGEIKEARKLFESALQRKPRLAEAFRGLGVCDLGEDNALAAIECFRKALEIDPNHIKSRLGYSSALWRIGNKDEAFQGFVDICNHAPEEIAALFLLIDASYALGKFTELENALRKYISVHNDNPEIVYCLAGCLYKQGRFAESGQAVRQALELSPTHAGAKELQDLLAGEMSKSKTVNAASLSPAPSPSNWVPSARLAKFDKLKVEKKYEELVQEADRVLSAETLPSDETAAIQVRKAESLACLERLEEAEQLFSSLAEGSSVASRAMAGLGALKLAKGELEAGEAVFRRVLASDQNSDTAHAGMAICEEQRGELEKSWDSYQRALAINPENLRAILGVIQLGYRLGRLNQILLATERYLDSHPANLSILYAHAGCLYGLERYSEAQSELEKIMLFDPQHELARELLDKIKHEHSSGSRFVN